MNKAKEGLREMIRQDDENHWDNNIAKQTLKEIGD